MGSVKERATLARCPFFYDWIFEERKLRLRESLDLGKANAVCFQSFLQQELVSVNLAIQHLSVSI